ADPEVLKNLSYDPPGQDLLSNEQNREAWQTFVKTYETPVRKVQDWYNSITDKDSADAAADSFNKDVLPILKKLTGRSTDMKKQVLAIPASPEMQKFILLRILQLQSRLLVIFSPMKEERQMHSNTCYCGSKLLFETILGLTAPSSIAISQFVESRSETEEAMKATFQEPWSSVPQP
ncbi:hypothetical protein, partial [Akkermansia sp.]